MGFVFFKSVFVFWFLFVWVVFLFVVFLGLGIIGVLLFLRFLFFFWGGVLCFRFCLCFLVLLFCFGHQTIRKQSAENPAWLCASQLRRQRVQTQAGALGWNPF